MVSNVSLTGAYVDEPSARQSSRLGSRVSAGAAPTVTLPVVKAKAVTATVDGLEVSARGRVAELVSTMRTVRVTMSAEPLE